MSEDKKTKGERMGELMKKLLRVLIIGSGGREHALARPVAKSKLVERVFCAPGNGGTGKFATNVNIKATDIQGIIKFALENFIDIVFIGPEDPLVLGLVDACDAVGIKAIGPTRAAAMLEGSKIFTRETLNGIVPQPKFEVFSEVGAARAYIRDRDFYPIVIKVDGLAGGKGAMVCQGPNDVDIAFRRIESGEFGEAAKRFLVEEFLDGVEASYIVFVDKNGHYQPWATSQDHKRIGDNDTGDNTGGMGAYSPAPIVTPVVESRTLERIVRPTIEIMARRGTPVYGFVYFGLMIDQDSNPYLVEINVRLGDPETQPILARLITDIVEVFLAMLAGELDKVEIEWDSRVAVCVVMAEDGYPDKDKYSTGHLITGIEKARAKGAIVDHAGTKVVDGKVSTDGGRVMDVTDLDKEFSGAIRKTYNAVREIHWGSEYYRNDIGQKALNR